MARQIPASSLPPKVMAPRHISETKRPVRPSCLNLIRSSPCVGRSRPRYMVTPVAERTRSGSGNQPGQREDRQADSGADQGAVDPDELEVPSNLQLQAFGDGLGVPSGHDLR